MTDWSRRALAAAPVVAVGLYILFQYNVWPGALPNSASYFVSVGTAECFAATFPHDLLTCQFNGLPDGLTVAFGYPQLLLIALVRGLTRLDLLNSFRLVWAALLMIAFIGARRLVGQFVRTDWIAWGAAALYLLAPIVSNQAGYGALQLGFALVPTYLLIDIRFLHAVDRRSRWLAAIGALMVATRVFALFTDGYSFIMSLVPAAVVYLLWGIRRLRRPGRRVRTLVAWATALLSVVVAYLLYAAYLGVSSFAPESIDFFRGQGVDLYPQFVPSSTIWLADLIGLHHSVTATQAYSDGPNLTDVFLGWGLLVTAAIGLAAVIRSRRHRSRELIAIGVAGIVGFVLALGPSLKIADFRVRQVLTNGVPTPDQYRMPAAKATLATGLAWIYQHVPGIETMRALYRWELLVKLALLIFAAVGVAALLRRGLRWPAAVLVLLVVLETLPSPVVAHRTGGQALSTVDRFTRDVITPLAAQVHPGERVLLVNPALGGSGANHYLANWICPALRLRCFNAGGDKAEGLVAAGRPPAVRDALRSPRNLRADIADILGQDEADAVILVNFDLRANAYYWPALPQQRQAAEDAGTAVLAGSDYLISDQEWTSVVRLR